MKTLRDKEKLIFELSVEGKTGIDIDFPVKEKAFEGEYKREGEIGLPQVSEVEVVRHFTRLSKMNYGVDDGFYPLGSCTMKHNPKMNEKVATMEGFLYSHPMFSYNLVQGSLKAMKVLQDYLCEITGMDFCTLQPAAGAHGELTGMMMVRRYHEKKGNPRKYVLIPDSAHGTNPATSTFAGYQVIEIKSDETGCVDLEALKETVNEDVAALMLTNPNTLGVFEKNIKQIANILHEKDALLYMDGANMNALMGIVKPGEMGVDVMHLNLHKTFSTPHGGGGPGSGPVCFKSHLKDYQPVPVIEGDDDNGYTMNWNLPDSIGKVHGFYGNFLVTLKALAYIMAMGGEGLKQTTIDAVLNANYVREKLKGYYNLPFKSETLHEVVFNDKIQEEYGVSTLDIAKRLIDYGIHPPTIYFPLIVHGAIMIEPTESESKEEIDYFVEVMKKVAEEAKENPEILHEAPHYTPVRRLDETLAARKPVLKWEREND
ncbi:glycine dehydrogenase subunit 2 [Thermotomaculum hydrothermale]|uniref:Probable glycine dehydrogenase (decarboxylating) subunit 2 n=1 Tax=Thermotomaculum hydrothermale TaxID=981385 RepID=A0A7R6PDU7_9BACT|nr:aminomethyl-transferring glycine dehydrogenase subunit GcvPB [Thermotomaculum hydrothermale]BBB31924.1 glycine dehydrogenase subunit 2 [Thermotomaculum hydrothermale]